MSAPGTSPATLDRAARWLTLCALAAAGARTGSGVLLLVAGAGLLLAALVQPAQDGRGTNWLGGNGSTYAMLLGFGGGLLALGHGRHALSSLPPRRTPRPGPSTRRTSRD